MIKHISEDLSVVFSEIPDEITLAFNISNCQNHCVGCHSPYLQKDLGEELTDEKVKDYIEKNPGISCVCFMGEGNDQEALLNLAKHIKEDDPKLKVALYSGRQEVEEFLYDVFDYIKTGPYIEELGPLNSRTTNQKLYKKFGDGWEDITYRFWGESFKDHEKAKYLVNPEKEQKILNALKKKKEKFGLEYCPCVLPKLHTDKVICPCENYRMTGKCHCGLYKE